MNPEYDQGPHYQDLNNKNMGAFDTILRQLLYLLLPAVFLSSFFLFSILIATLTSIKKGYIVAALAYFMTILAAWVIVRLIVCYRLNEKRSSSAKVGSKDIIGDATNIWYRWWSWLIQYERCSLKFAHFNGRRRCSEFELSEIPAKGEGIFTPVGSARVLRDQAGNIYMGIPALFQSVSDSNMADRSTIHRGELPGSVQFEISTQTIHPEEFLPLAPVIYSNASIGSGQAGSERSDSQSLQSSPRSSSQHLSEAEIRPCIPAGTTVLVDFPPDDPYQLPWVTLSSPEETNSSIPRCLIPGNTSSWKHRTPKRRRGRQQLKEDSVPPNRDVLFPEHNLPVPPRNRNHHNWQRWQSTQSSSYAQQTISELEGDSRNPRSSPPAAERKRTVMDVTNSQQKTINGPQPGHPRSLTNTFASHEHANQTCRDRMIDNQTSSSEIPLTRNEQSIARSYYRGEGWVIQGTFEDIPIE